MRQIKISQSITARESASLHKYLNEVARQELISPEEEVSLTMRIRQGDQAALEKLVKANLRFVISVAKQYQNKGMDLPDLINEGNIGLITAAKRFDETRGFKFISFAVWWIRQSISQALTEKARMVRLPANRVGDINKIKRAETELEQRFGRDVSLSEIADSLKMHEDEVMISHSISKPHLSADMPLGDPDGISLIDVLSNEEQPNPDHELMAVSVSTEIKRALSHLQDRERDIVKLSFGIGCDHAYSTDEIGEKFELTRERVRQIKEKALRKLKMLSERPAFKTVLG